MLALHPTFDLACGIVVDDLHGLFLGVTLTLLRLWFDSNRNKPFFIGNKVVCFKYYYILPVGVYTTKDHLEYTFVLY